MRCSDARKWNAERGQYQSAQEAGNYCDGEMQQRIFYDEPNGEEFHRLCDGGCIN
jgi:hypothetical protein